MVSRFFIFILFFAVSGSHGKKPFMNALMQLSLYVLRNEVNLSVFSVLGGFLCVKVLVFQMSSEAPDPEGQHGAFPWDLLTALIKK